MIRCMLSQKQNHPGTSYFTLAPSGGEGKVRGAGAQQSEFLSCGKDSSSYHASSAGPRGRAVWPAEFDVPCAAAGASDVPPQPETAMFLARHITWLVTPFAED